MAKFFHESKFFHIIGLNTFKSVFCLIIVGFLIVIPFTSCGDDKEEDFSEKIVTDIEGNTYRYVTIGSQTWMAENLRTTKLNDGTNIPNVTDQGEWISMKAPAYCWYDNDSTNQSSYGALYNWFSIEGEKLCPTGWHVPTDAEWTELVTLAGSEAGGMLKEKGFEHWSSPNTGATDVYGFSALPGGCRYFTDGSFNNLGHLGFWWTATEFGSKFAYRRCMDYDDAAVGKFSRFHKEYGFSVRCVMD